MEAVLRTGIYYTQISEPSHNVLVDYLREKKNPSSKKTVSNRAFPFKCELNQENSEGTKHRKKNYIFFFHSEDFILYNTLHILKKNIIHIYMYIKNVFTEWNVLQLF